MSGGAKDQGGESWRVRRQGFSLARIMMEEGGRLVRGVGRVMVGRGPELEMRCMIMHRVMTREGLRGSNCPRHEADTCIWDKQEEGED